MDINKDLGSIIGHCYTKYKEYALYHDLLTMTHLTRLNKGDKIKLAIFTFNDNKWNEFEFTFDRIEDPILVNSSWVKKMVYGESDYTKVIPLWIPRYRNHVRFTIQADKSPIFIANCYYDKLKN